MILYLIFFIWHLLSSSCESFHKIFKNILSFIITFTLDHIKSLLECSSVSELTNAQSALHKKWSFPLRISSVIVTKSEVFCGFGQIYWRNPSFIQCCGIWKIEKKFLCLYWKKLYEFLSVTKTVLKDILVEKEVPDVIENVVALKYVFKVMF